MAQWNKVDQSEIARTVRDVAACLLSKEIGPAHSALAESWLKPDGLADQIEQMDQAKLNGLFGENDPQNYWPGKFRPSLIDLYTSLKFLAYREKLQAQPPTAQSLMDRIEAFDGFGGECHLAITALCCEARNYINAFPRHASESYVAPPAPIVDECNCLNYAFNWLENKWLPAGEDTVEARLEMGGNACSIFDGRTKDQELARMKDTIAEGFRRGSIKAEISVQFGQTYGEDAVVIRASLEEYQKFVDIKREQRPVDNTPSDEFRPWGNVPGFRTDDKFQGYESGKPAFYGPAGGVYISASSLQELKRSSGMAEEIIDWLRETGFVMEEPVSLHLPSGAGSFVKFTRQEIPFQNNKDCYPVGDKLWTSCNLHNEINARLSIVAEVCNALKDAQNEFLTKLRAAPVEKLMSHGK